ncbi:hypothetical protein Tco_0949880 [Tanacetum coccineum]
MKAEALKEQTTASRPIKALMVYPPNTPTTLVPRMLPTKSQVKINIFTLTQLFSEFEKTCKKRITPTGLTEGEMGFEQTKEYRKHDEIERKNLLIANDNLIADCLSKEVFYIATNFELNVSRFTEMHDDHTVLKYQNLKESFGNNTSPPARDAPDFDSVFKIAKMKASIQGKDNAIKKLRMQISQLKETRSEADRTLDFRALDF